MHFHFIQKNTVAKTQRIEHTEEIDFGEKS